MASGTRKSILLDVDPTIMENNLLLKAGSDDELQTLLTAAAPQKEGSWKYVNPQPGFCLKGRRSADDPVCPGGKVFINFCHCPDGLPEPEDIDEKGLMEILEEPEETCTFRIALSIGEGREEPDKSGRPATVYDVAMNSNFFLNKVEKSKVFRQFTMNVVVQGVMEKFNISVELDDCIILKHRKAMGTILPHKVMIRRQGETGSKGPLIMEMGSKPAEAATTRQPVFRLLKEPASGQTRNLIAEVQLPDVVSVRELLLEVGQDRVVLEGQRRGYLLDFFLPHLINQDDVNANFNIDSKILTLSMPVSPAC